MRWDTDRGGRNRQSVGLGPVESTLFVEPDVADQQDAEEDEHGDECEGAHMLREPETITNGPGEKEDRLDVEDDEEHGHDIEPGGIASAGIAFGRDAALIREELRRSPAGFRANEFEDQKSENRKRKNEQGEDQDGNVGSGHGFYSFVMLAHRIGRGARGGVTRQRAPALQKTTFRRVVPLRDGWL